MQTQKNSHCRLWLGRIFISYLRKAGHTVHLYEKSRYQADSVLGTFNKFSNVKQGLESARWCWDIGFSSRNRNTHGQTRYSLGRQATFKIMVKKVIYSISRGR
jgi:hypothetical protein